MKTNYLFLIAAFILVISTSVTSATDKYRLMINSNPSTEITIGWNQISGSLSVVYFGTMDYGTNWENYSDSASSYRSTLYMGMNNQFVKLTDLSPNTAYYFVIKDSEGVSERYWFRTISDDNTERLSFVAGGDSRSGITARRNSNRMVAKLRPHAVFFGGDLVATPDDSSVQTWLYDWQLTITADNQIIPVVHSFGNHEAYGAGGGDFIRNLFDTPVDTYYNVNFANNLFSMYVLNTELLPEHTAEDSIKRMEQINWLNNTLSSDSSIWKSAQYHTPILPHYSGKPAQNDAFNDWANAFYDNGVRLIIESDAHVVKITEEVKPAIAIANDDPDSWFTMLDIAPEKGITFIGEGTWGTRRPADKDYAITIGKASFYGFNLIFVDQCNIEIRTLDTQSPSTIMDRSESSRFDINADIEEITWKPSAMPSGLKIISKCSCPKAFFSTENPNSFINENINFSDGSANSPTSWFWDFGDGNFSDQQNPVHVYSNLGTYSVKLIATNEIGYSTLIKHNYIEIFEQIAPGAHFTVSKTDAVLNEAIQFTSSSTNNPTSWFWDFGDGITSTEYNPSHTYVSEGIYSVVLTVKNPYGQNTVTKTDYINISNSSSMIIPVFEQNDIVEEYKTDGSLFFNNPSISLNYNSDIADHQIVGLRFQNTGIPKGAVIESAYIQFKCANNSIGDLILKIEGHDADNSHPFVGHYDVSDRRKTSAFINWSPDAWTDIGAMGENERTGDLKLIIQEIVNRSGWHPDNAISFLITEDMTNLNSRTASSFNDSYTPQLYISYSVYSDINELNTVSSILVFPNPTSGKITIEGKDIKKIEVLDFNGLEIQNIQVESKLINIDISNQAKGIYFIKILSLEGIIIKKIILKY